MSGKSGKGAAKSAPRAYGRLTRHERDTVQQSRAEAKRGQGGCAATSTNRERGGRFVRGSVRPLEASQRRCNFELWRLSLSRAGSHLDICACITILV